MEAPRVFAVEDGWAGLVRCQGRRFWASVAMKNGEAKLSMEAELALLLRGQEGLLQQRLVNSVDFDAFLVELTELADRTLSPLPSVGAMTAPPLLILRLIPELDAVGWDRVEMGDAQLQSLSLRSTDAGGREHLLHISVPLTYPNAPLACRSQVPDSTAETWPAANIAEANETFSRQLKTFQRFWNELDELHARCWVLEPQRDQRDRTMLRVAVDQTVSVQLLLDAKEPTSLPSIRFLGPDVSVGPLKDLLNKNISAWSRALSVRANLEACLERSLPPKPSATDASAALLQMECAVCYAFHLGDEMPTKSCNNAACGRSYHQTCIAEWLRALPSTRVSFQSLFGACPYCQEPINVQLALA